MSRHAFAMALFALAFGVHGAARADEATALFARSKAASGGAHWDTLKSVHSRGALSAGGLNGPFEAVQELSSGRSSDHYTLGAVEGAEGYDGKLAWQRDPGGEVAALDAPEARQRARSQAWLDARGYWYPQRMSATYGKVESRELDHKRYDVVAATPAGGDPVILWFAADSHLLARVVQKQGADTTTTVFDDWRDEDGIRLPFHSVNDVTDAAGRTDPRSRSEVRIEHVAFNGAVTDADFAMPAMVATAHIDGASGITRVPFDLVSNHIYVDGSIDGKSARFLVDTGGANLLTPAAAKKFGITGEGKLAGRGVGDDVVDVSLAHANEVRVGAAVLAKPVFAVMDLGKLSAVEGVPSDGLVGYEMFRRFGVTIDYQRHELVLAEQAKFVPPPGASVVPFELADRIPIVQGSLDGLPVRLSVDTGSRVSLTLHSPFVREHGLVAKYQAAPESVIGWGVGGPSRGRPARFGSLTLGGLPVADIAGDMYTGDKGAFATPDISGNLGGGVLKRFTVAFDYVAKRMYLTPNAAFNAPDVFDRSGLWLLGDGDALKVSDSTPDSAAARAGLQVDDRILSIDGESIAKRGLSEWRQRLRELPAGTQLSLHVIRNGAAVNAHLVLADRIPAKMAAEKITQ